MQKPLKFPHKRNSARIIVDEYDQIRKQRDEEAVCQLCLNQIPLRLMVLQIITKDSHIRVCQLKRLEIYDREQANTEMFNYSAFTEKNRGNKYFSSQTNAQETPVTANKNKKNSHLNCSQRKLSNKKNEIDNFSMKKTNSIRNLWQKQGKRTVSQNKNSKGIKNSGRKITVRTEKCENKIRDNRSLAGQQYNCGVNPGCLNKKRPTSRLKKQIKSTWASESRRMDTKQKQLYRKNAEQFHERQRMKRMQNQKSQLKKKQRQILQYLQKQKKQLRKGPQKSPSINKRTQNNINRQESRNRNPASRQARNPSRNRNESSQNARPRQNRNQTLEQSYYEQIPVHYPHRTLNFISHTINQQFQMMKQQFEHINEFFSNFTPFGNQNFVYFERSQDSDYSIDSSGSDNLDQGYQHQGLDEEQIELLPSYSYGKRVGRDQQCAVCISSLKNNQTVRRLPCHHLFHAECIDQWLKRKADCPVCREPITDLGN